MFERVFWVSGMPRSGTSWMAQILASHPDVRLKLCPLFSYEMRGSLDARSTREDWLEFLERAYETPSDYMDQTFLRRDGLVPDFGERADAPQVLAIKSVRFHHLLPRALELGVPIRFVFMIRDPREAIGSWLANPTEFPVGADPVEEWRSGACRKTSEGEFWGFDDWMYVSRLYLDLEARHPDRIRLLRYERLVADPVEETERLFAFMNLEVHDQTRRFLTASTARHDSHPRSVFKRGGHLDDPGRRLPPGAAETIERLLRGTELERFLSLSAGEAPVR